MKLSDGPASLRLACFNGLFFLTTNSHESPSFAAKKTGGSKCKRLQSFV
jgi:hypothetical protein